MGVMDVVVKSEYVVIIRPRLERLTKLKQERIRIRTKNSYLEETLWQHDSDSPHTYKRIFTRYNWQIVTNVDKYNFLEKHSTLTSSAIKAKQRRRTCTVRYMDYKDVVNYFRETLFELF